MRTLSLALCLTCACSSSHNPEGPAGSDGAGSGSGAGQEASGSAGDGSSTGDQGGSSPASSGTSSSNAADPTSASEPLPLTSAEVFDLCDEFCTAIEGCEGQAYGDCISDCTRLGDNDRTAECDDRARQAVQCLIDLDCRYLESQTGELDLRPTPCASFLDDINGNCGG